MLEGRVELLKDFKLSRVFVRQLLIRLFNPSIKARNISSKVTRSLGPTNAPRLVTLDPSL